MVKRRKRRVGPSERSTAEDVARFAMAGGDQKRIVDYANRGRPRAAATDDDLRRDLRQCLEVLGRDAVEPHARLAFDDIGAEYSLRGQRAPISDYPDLIDGFFKSVEATCRGYSQEQIDQINADLYAEYDQAQRAKN